MTPEPMSAERRAEIEGRAGFLGYAQPMLRDLLAENDRLTATLRQLTEPAQAVVEAAAEAMYLAHWPHQAHRAPWESLPEWGRDGWRILARAALAAGVEAAGGDQS